MRPLLAGLVAALLLVQGALAGERINAKPGGLAVKGYDVVAYFTLGEPTPGDPGIEYTWRDVKWRFASEAHKDAFVADPARYAPRYGGFCAGGVALGRMSPIDPEAFVIVDGRLYLNFDKPTAEEVRTNPEEILSSADANWERLGKTD